MSETLIDVALLESHHGMFSLLSGSQMTLLV